MDDNAVFESVCRKLDDAVGSLATMHENGVLNDREFRIAMEALRDATGGTFEVMDEYMQALAGMDLKEVKQQRVFTNGEKVFLLCRNGVVTSIQSAITGAETNIQAWFNEAEAVEHLDKMAGAMRKKGFREL